MTPTIRTVQEAVCARYQVAMSEMVGHDQSRRFSRPRQVAYYLARNLCRDREGKPASYPAIARRFGERNHTTIMHGERVMANRIAGDPALAADVSEIAETLGAPTQEKKQ